MVNKIKELVILIVFVIILFLLPLHYQHSDSTHMVMGGKLNVALNEDDEKETLNEQIDVEKYFRPSMLPILNGKDMNDLIYSFHGKDFSEIKLPNSLFKTEEETIINYFSVLREAANPADGIKTGCGTIGNATSPYPIAYHFLSSKYQEKLTYKRYVDTFKNILHINLIKLKKIPVNGSSDHSRFFIEIETIEGSPKDAAYFAYYYGFVDLIKEGEQYRISNLDFYGENYLCAPYHGWSFDAEAVVDIKYGGWCDLVKERYPTQQNDFIKKIYFKGTDGNDYCIEFFQLTNGTDLEIAQYIKREDQDWELIKLDPNQCINN
ncbi:MAG: hypothetical protein VB095_07730 [Anaerovorax sp.]|nr:hypothetical protein [Anaerovorax sp.]